MKKIVIFLFAPIFLLLLLTTSCDEQANTAQQNTTAPQNVTQPRNVTGAVAEEEEVKGEPAKTFTEKDLTFEGKQIKVTHHARCRMDCRTIDAGEIQEIINKKQINQRKSKPNPSNGRCPSYAYEGRTGRDNQRLRIILGNCEDDPIIITVIDLENEYQCSCK